MEEYENNNIVEDDGTNTLIQETFTTGMDDGHDDFDDIHDIPLLEKERQPLYEGSKKILYLLYCFWST